MNNVDEAKISHSTHLGSDLVHVRHTPPLAYDPSAQQPYVPYDSIAHHSYAPYDPSANSSYDSLQHAPTLAYGSSSSSAAYDPATVRPIQLSRTTGRTTHRQPRPTRTPRTTHQSYAPYDRPYDRPYVSIAHSRTTPPRTTPPRTTRPVQPVPRTTPRTHLQLQRTTHLQLQRTTHLQLSRTTSRFNQRTTQQPYVPYDSRRSRPDDPSRLCTYDSANAYDFTAQTVRPVQPSSHTERTIPSAYDPPPQHSYDPSYDPPPQHSYDRAYDPSPAANDSSPTPRELLDHPYPPYDPLTVRLPPSTSTAYDSSHYSTGFDSRCHPPRFNASSESNISKSNPVTENPKTENLR